MDLSQPGDDFKLLYLEKAEFFRRKSRKETLTFLLNKKRLKLQNPEEFQEKFLEKVRKKWIIFNLIPSPLFIRTFFRILISTFQNSYQL